MMQLPTEDRIRSLKASLRARILPAFRELRHLLPPAWQQIRSRAWRPTPAILLILAGICLLAYVASQYWSMHHAQQQLQAQWERQQDAAMKAANTSRPAVDPRLTRMHIPRINLEAMVVEGDSRKQLLIGPGHIVQTPLPGEPGNSVITGHRDTFFRHIFELSKGDEILVQRNGQTFRYSVTGKKIVQPEDTSVLEPTSDAELTLITCYPTYYIGPAPKRLVVFSKLMDTQEADPQNRPAAN